MSYKIKVKDTSIAINTSMLDYDLLQIDYWVSPYEDDDENIANLFWFYKHPVYFDQDLIIDNYEVAKSYVEKEINMDKVRGEYPRYEYEIIHI